LVLVAQTISMRLSSLKAAHASASSFARQEIRSGPDDAGLGANLRLAGPPSNASPRAMEEAYEEGQARRRALFVLQGSLGNIVHWKSGHPTPLASFRSSSRQGWETPPSLRALCHPFLIDLPRCPKQQRSSLCACARRRIGRLCKCADDQGKAVANQQALDQDARVVAPGEDRKAKRKGDGISFS
jgi:hypothetical protein